MKGSIKIKNKRGKQILRRGINFYHLYQIIWENVYKQPNIEESYETIKKLTNIYVYI